MVIRGQVNNGIVVLENGSAIPEGTAVIVSYPISRDTSSLSVHRVMLPLIPSQNPGSRILTADRIADLLVEDDVPA